MEESGVSILGVDLNVFVLCYRLENRESEKRDMRRITMPAREKHLLPALQS